MCSIGGLVWCVEQTAASRCHRIAPKPGAFLAMPRRKYNPSANPRIQTFVTNHSSIHVAKCYVGMLTMVWSAMLRLTNLRYSGHRRWCTAVVLLSVCCLTVCVTTRYSSSPARTGDQSVTSIQNHQSWTPGLQRLLNNAAAWTPPVVDSAIFQHPRSSRHIEESGPTVSSVYLERKLCNRPPPILSLL